MRSALITGGSSGIGLAIARMLRDEGFELTLASRARVPRLVIERVGSADGVGCASLGRTAHAGYLSARAPHAPAPSRRPARRRLWERRGERRDAAACRSGLGRW